MRFRIHLAAHRSRKYLPLDYQYAMASAVYKLIAKGDAAYSRFLHDEGFTPGGLRRFKLFTFSSLKLPRFTLWKDKGIFELHDYELSFVVSFMADKAAEAFIKGMFVDQHLSVGDRFHQFDTEVTAVEAMAPPIFRETMQYRCLSPLTIEFKDRGQRYEQYLPPDDPRFEELLLQNLISKCAAFEILHDDKRFDHESMQFQLQGQYKSKLITIKAYTPQETRIRGYMFDFSLTAPEHIHEMGYYAGFGMNNGMGFGAVDTN